ncbi:GNAT family N-acetyltransferase [Paraglaciecola aquimarina]|uniref:GNAT family N-acetyltransferase n=1 Tax=Paraglaciecola algarum TaxID=3050085 RepID=A0ABS9D1G1_9ALTE|nr:GNAT family protein [Paraglaciecola sp. G1-23]MCF2946758.1 GNAT family N-acetyltransferase [Paraglaciecola sp. G1-23]
MNDLREVALEEVALEEGVLEEITLEDGYVALEPMTQGRTKDLYEAGRDLAIWKWTTSNYCSSMAATETWVNTCLRNFANAEQQPFVIVDKRLNKVVGSTSYLNIALQHKVIEVGYTFLNPRAQRTYINRRCKLLLLTHAFETLKLNRVALQTHEKNQQSRRAILGIGAKFEGIHRYARIQHDGSIRNSAFYSIIKSEWPAVKQALKQKVNKP